ncbi:hypothetical protein KHA93_02635 [Bacillus sp. FJAT-49732]|uniref:Uncharacterized protein n=1 Tax=Lederbergia citrisecunda TaxID=2833583 RepID=A0A942YJV9_9BACI|nr:hypothetical protein [Lederbergia citrisecunda]MBS4198544.1 hypothetical protein [Lederbergia citrisecunda]
MKKEKKHNKTKKNDIKNDRKQSVDDYFDQESGQPVPQPKDYEEIDY